MARIIQDLLMAASCLVVDFDKEPPFVVNSSTQMVDGTSHVTKFGWKRYATITYHWANHYEKENLTNLPEVGLDTLVPSDEGWSYEEPSVQQISPTIHMWTITVRAVWHGPEKPAY